MENSFTQTVCESITVFFYDVVGVPRKFILKLIDDAIDFVG